MKINIKGTQYQLTAEVRDYLDKKLAAIGKFIDESQGEAICDVELEHQNAQKHGHVFRAEINLNAHGEFFRVEDTGESMHAAIDAVHDEIVRRLRKGKNKSIRNVRRGGAKLKEMMRGDEI